MCGGCSLTAFTSDASVGVLDVWRGGPFQVPDFRVCPGFMDCERTKAINAFSLLAHQLWWVSSHFSVYFCSPFFSLPSLPSLLPCGASLAFPPWCRAAHLTEPDTEICAANSLHSHGSVWCHNWHAIDLCLLLQRPEWLMSRASCHNRPCPGLLPLGCSPHSFLSSAICCGWNPAETMLISFLHGDYMGRALIYYLVVNNILYISNL